MTTFDQWFATRYGASLPWDVSKECLREAWDAALVAQSMVAANNADVRNIKEFFGNVRLDAGAPNITAEDIYAAYPRKVGKQAAIKAIKKAAGNSGDGAMDYLMERVQAYATAVKTWPAADKQFIPHPATWFNRGSYDDDPKEWVRHNPATASQFSKTH